MNNEVTYMTITTDEYQYLKEQTMKYSFLLTILLDKSGVDNRNKIDFAYSVDDVFDNFMETFEKDTAEEFKARKISEKDRMSNE